MPPVSSSAEIGATETGALRACSSSRGETGTLCSIAHSHSSIGLTNNLSSARWTGRPRSLIHRCAVRSLTPRKPTASARLMRIARSPLCCPCTGIVAGGGTPRSHDVQRRERGVRVGRGSPTRFLRPVLAEQGHVVLHVCRGVAPHQSEHLEQQWITNRVEDL